MENAIEVKELTKFYGSLLAVDHVSFEVKGKEIFGLLGPNGAGKTTTVKILCTLLEPTGGQAFVKGYDVVKDAARVRRIVNMVAGGERMLYYRLTGRENLEYFAELYDVPKKDIKSRVDRLLRLVGLSDRTRRIFLRTGCFNDLNIVE